MKKTSIHAVIITMLALVVTGCSKNKDSGPENVPDAEIRQAAPGTHYPEKKYKVYYGNPVPSDHPGYFTCDGGMRLCWFETDFVTTAANITIASFPESVANGQIKMRYESPVQSTQPSLLNVGNHTFLPGIVAQYNGCVSLKIVPGDYPVIIDSGNPFGYVMLPVEP